MPRAFANWNDRKRPDPRLFVVPATTPAEGMGYAPDGMGNEAQVDELEQLIAGLLEDVSPILQDPPPGVHQQDGIDAMHVVPTSFPQAAAAAGSGGSRTSSSTVHGHTGTAPDSKTCEGESRTHTSQGANGDSAPPAAFGGPIQMPSAPLPPAEFLWSPIDSCIVTTDANGLPVDCSLLPSYRRLPFQVHIAVHPALLYWGEKRQWMWHRKWALPAITVRIEQQGSPAEGAAGAVAAPSAGSGAAIGEAAATAIATQKERFFIFVTAGTMGDDLETLEHRGLGGDCQRTLQLGPSGVAEATFTRLLFQQTSFNCGNRPFHLVVTLLVAPRGHGAAMQARASAADNGALGPSLVPVACITSSPVRVDARKRSKGERPEAAADDVRLASRQRPTSALVNSASRGPFAADPSDETAAPAAGGNGKCSALGVPGGGSDALVPGGGAAAGVATSGPPAAHAGAVSLQPMAMLTDGAGGPDLRFTAQSLMDATSDAVVELRGDGVIVSMLSSSAFGYTASQLLGRSFLTICHTDEHPGLLQTMQALLLMHERERGPTGAERAGPQQMRLPQSIRILHRVIIGLGGDRTAETIAVDSILSVTAARLAGGSSATLLLCARRALPVAPVDPNSTGFSFRVFPWPAT